MPQPATAGPKRKGWFDKQRMSNRNPVVVVLENPRLLLKPDEAARYLRVSRRTLQILKKTKQVTFTRVREGLRFRLRDLNEYLDKRTVVAI